MSQIPITETRATGWVADEPDNRDFIFSNLIKTGRATPPTADQPYQTILWRPEIIGQPDLSLKDLSQNSPGVYNQGDRMQSCVANGIALAACYAWHKQPGQEQDRITGTGDLLFNPSRWWIWYHARRFAGTEHTNSGCMIRNAFRAMHQFGCPPDSAWPYPALTSGDYPDIPLDVMNEALQENPDDNMYNIAAQHFINDFEYYSIKSKHLDDFWWDFQGDSEPPPEAEDRIIQMQTALAEGYPIVFAIGEFIIHDQHPEQGGNWDNKHFAPMWDQDNWIFGENIEGGLADDVVMKPLDPGFFPIDNPRLVLGDRPNGHVMVVVGSDAKRELFLCQNSYGLYDDQRMNRWKKPFFWCPYDYFRTKIVDATWVIRYKPGSRGGNQPPPIDPSTKPFVTIQWTDDFTGANMNQAIQATGNPVNLTDILQTTNIGSDGNITSIQLKGAPQSAVATVKKDGQVLGVAKGSGNDYAQWPRTSLAGVTIELTV